MSRETPLGRIVRGVLLTLVGLFFLFPIVWVFLMSFQTNATILRIPPVPALRADARELRRADLGPAGDAGRHAARSPS